MRQIKGILALVLVVGLIAGTIFIGHNQDVQSEAPPGKAAALVAAIKDDADRAGNPCSGKKVGAPTSEKGSKVLNPCNPCSGAKSSNPCNLRKKAKASNPCNPCGRAKSAAQPTVPVNPCHAKQGTVFHIGDAMGRDTITFTSQAPLEDIVGMTNRIGGYVVFDPADPAKGGHGEFIIPVTSLDSGIPLRDEHLRSAMWLDAETYPNITFRIDETRLITLIKETTAFKTYDVLLVGGFTLHGVTKQVEIPGRVTYLKESEKTKEKMPGDLLAVRASFEIRLADFGIISPPGSDLIGTKVGETISLQVSMIASNRNPSAAGNPCNPCNPCSKKAKNPCNPCGGKKVGSASSMALRANS